MAAKKTGGLNLPATCSATDLAEILGINRRNVLDRAARGELVRASQKGRFQTLPSVHAYINSLRETAAGRATTGGRNLADEKAEQVRIATQISEIKLAQLRGEVLTLDEVRQSWSAFAQAVKATVLSLPTMARNTIPHLTPHDGETLRRICRDKLADLAKEVESIVVAGDSEAISDGK